MIVVTVGGALLLLTGFWNAWDRLAPIPTQSEAQTIVFGGDLVAYETWDDVPRVVFRHEGKLILDRLRLDSISIQFPPGPRWQLSGQWYSMATTSDPASVGLVACGEACSSSVLFGELDAASGIVALEVQYGGAWHRHAVAGAGYVVRLDGFTGVPDEYRWLDAAGTLVWSSGRVVPLEY